MMKSSVTGKANIRIAKRSPLSISSRKKSLISVKGRRSWPNPDTFAAVRRINVRPNKATSDGTAASLRTYFQMIRGKFERLPGGVWLD